jgi:hypothetical protein
MNSMSAFINFKGQAPIPVTVSAAGIFDNLGRPALPADVTVDLNSMTLLKNGKVVGSISDTAQTATLSNVPLADDSTARSVSAGSANSISSTNDTGPVTIDDGGVVLADKDTPVEAAEPTQTGMHITETRADGMWRPAKDDGGDPGDGDPGDGDPGDGGPGDGGPGDGNTPDDQWHDDGTGGGGGGGGGAGTGDGTSDAAGQDGIDVTDFVDAQEDLNVPVASPSKIMGTLATIGGITGLLSSIASGALGKVLGIAGVGFGGLALGKSMFDLGRDFTWTGLGSAAASAFGVLASIGSLMAVEGSGMSGAFAALMANPWVLAAVGAFMATMYFIGKFGKPKAQAFDATKDPGAMPNANKGLSATELVKKAPQNAWFRSLPGAAYQNVFILLGMTSLGIGINLANGGPMTQSIAVSASALPGIQGQLQDATRKVVPNDLSNKVFIKLGENPTTDPAKVVYVEQGTGKDQYNVNMVTLNSGGYYVGPNPDAARVAFFMVEPQTGALKANPEAAKALALERAMTQAANTAGLSAPGAARAVQVGAATGRYNQRVDQ